MGLDKMEFPYGKAPLGVLLLFLAAGAGLAFSEMTRRAEKKPDLIFATFTKEHAAAYKQVLPAFEALHHCKVQLQVVDPRALQGRLQSAMQVGADVPDAVELMEGFVSTFTKGRIEDVQLVDLTDRLHSSGLYDKLVTNRFSKWSSRNHIFALPHDVHPTMLAYRKDIVERLGIDVSKLTTWEEFSRVGRDVVTKDLNGDGVPDRYMIDLPTDGSDIVPLLALQHGGTLFDADGNVTFDKDDSFTDAICWYVKQIQGKQRISFPCGWGQNLAKAMIDGLVVFYFCPDWRTMQFQMDVPSMQGKMALMPLPAWQPGGLRTSTWGSTGLAFPKQGKNFELAWQLAMFLYYDPDQLGSRFSQTNILPPLKEAWAKPQFSQVNEYWNVSIGQTFLPFAPQVPANPSNPYYFTAVSKLSTAFTKASQYYQEHGEEGLRDLTRKQLHQCAEEVRIEINRNVFLRDDVASAAASGGAR